ncbi:MAG: hypothetical protein ACI4R8_02625, partial [Candidatus Caccovivens sp.]
NAQMLYTEFVFEVHEQSTYESPIPIETYEDFLNMKDGEYYILTDNIDLVGSEQAQVSGQQEFKPITASIAGLDGNSYKIRLSDSYNFSGLSEIGVFVSVVESAVLRNITIQLMSDTVFKLDSSTFNVGLLTASNNGAITNCRVESLNNSKFSVTSSATTISSYVAGLVATNNGTITNSQSLVNIFANVNLSGFVGQNNGSIASSYFMGGSLNNKNSDRTSLVKTAGFAVVNNGDINTSYVSGIQKTDKIYYDGEQNSIISSNNITGFVYTNGGSVKDCYSNITLTQSGAFASGFAIENSGTIARCISTSILSGNKSDSFAFLMSNISTNSDAKVEDCFYLSDDAERVNIGVEEIKDDNVSVKKLTIDDFKNIDNFKNFVVAEGRNVNSVWFYNENQADLTNFNGSIFGCARLELVAPNIIATSRRILNGIEEITDPETGATYNVYKYIYDSKYPALGSMYNPIVISNAEEMENYIKQESNSAGYNYSYFRLISNIDYSEYIYNSGLYKTKFLGYLEGNFMSISGISLISSESMTFAGLFAEIGSRTLDNAIGTVMNFTYKPNRVSFSNTNVVGAVAGKVDNGNVINVDVIPASTNAVVVTGKNIVGGAIGLGLGRYKLQNVYSQVSAKARNQEVRGNNFDESALSFDTFSFAGSVAGILSGEGYIYNCLTDTQISVLAHKAGLMFGFIDSAVKLEKVRLEMSANMLVNAYSYGGLVAGESKGSITDITIVGNGVFENFKKLPYTPDAVGGVAGLVSGGIISDVVMTQSIKTSTANETNGIGSVGAIAGSISASAKFSNIYVKANITGYQYVGGVAGFVDQTNGVVDFTDINVDGCALQILGHKMLDTGIGGLVGATHSVISLQTSQDAPNNRFNVVVSATIYVYEAGIKNHIGAVIGQNNSAVAHQIANVNSVLKTSSAFAVYDMSITDSNIEENLSVKETSVQGTYGLVSSLQDDETNSPFIKYSVDNTTNSNSTFDCNITFSKPNSSSGGAGYDLFVNFYGTPIMSA